MLTAKDNIVLPRRDTAVRSITGSSGRGPNSVVDIPDQTDFPGNMEDTPLMAESFPVDLTVDQDRNDETHNVENFENDDFPALRTNCDQQQHTHHNMQVRYLTTRKPKVSIEWFFNSLDRLRYPEKENGERFTIYVKIRYKKLL